MKKISAGFINTYFGHLHVDALSILTNVKEKALIVYSNVLSFRKLFVACTIERIVRRMFRCGARGGRRIKAAAHCKKGCDEKEN